MKTEYEANGSFILRFFKYLETRDTGYVIITHLKYFWKVFLNLFDFVEPFWPLKS
jgi:hypothetical protein